MFFTHQQLAQAARLKALGLRWTPTVGHWIHDARGLLTPSSPFQSHVYFLLDIGCFLRAVGDDELFKSSMVWLPTWEQSREALTQLDVSSEMILNELKADSAFCEGQELDALYRLIERSLSKAKELR